MLSCFPFFLFFFVFLLFLFPVSWKDKCLLSSSDSTGAAEKGTFTPVISLVSLVLLHEDFWRMPFTSEHQNVCSWFCPLCFSNLRHLHVFLGHHIGNYYFHPCDVSLPCCNLISKRLYICP